MTRSSHGFRRLLALDLRLSGRAFWALLGHRSDGFKIALVALVVVGLHGLALAPALWFGRSEDGPEGAAFLTAAFGYCLGCEMYGLIARLRTTDKGVTA